MAIKSLEESELLVVPEELRGVVLSEELAGGVHFRPHLEEELRLLFVAAEDMVALNHDCRHFLHARLHHRVGEGVLIS